MSELIDAIKRNPGDETAWQQWFEACYSRLYYVLYWKTRGDIQRAQDLAQESMLRFVRYRGYERTATDKDALAYLVRTALNLLADERAPLLVDDLPVEEIEDPSRAMEATERTSDVDTILAAMSDEDGVVLRMAIEGQTTSDIASSLGIPYTTAASRIHRAKARAKKIAEGLQKKT